MTRRRGSTLIELLVSMGILLTVLGVVFLLFGIGSRGFRTIEARQGLQNQLAAVRAAFQRDLQPSHFYGLGVDQTTSFSLHGVEQPRDALSAVALADWEAPGAQDLYGIPDWDCWAVYRVTKEAQGQLLRHTVTPAGGGPGRDLLGPAADRGGVARTTALHAASWVRVSPPQVLARGVRAFDVRLDAAQRAVEIGLTLEGATAPENPKRDVLTTSFFIRPHNTVPTD